MTSRRADRFDPGEYPCHALIDAPERLPIGEAKYFYAIGIEILCSPAVVFLFFRFFVSSPIDFNRKLQFQTIKIYDKRTETMLAPKFISASPSRS